VLDKRRTLLLDLFNALEQPGSLSHGNCAASELARGAHLHSLVIEVFRHRTQL
jgi:hypothetical protein